MEYIRATPKNGETMAELTTRLKIEFFQGSGYYKLTKSEKISARKDLVLFKDDRWIAGASDVRSELALGNGTITMSPTDLAHGCELFVQSTSHNRKLQGGHDALFRKSAACGSSGSSVKISVFGNNGNNGKMTKKTPQTRLMSCKRQNYQTIGKRDNAKGEGHGGRPRTRPRTDGGGRIVEDTGNGQDDQGDGNRSDSDRDPDSASNNNRDGVVVWSRLLFPLNDEVECLDETSLVVGAAESGIPGDCDLPVPINLVEGTVSMILDGAIRGVTTWRLVEQTVQETEPDRSHGFISASKRYQWNTDENGGCRLMYVDSPNASFIALELSSNNYGLVCGNCNGHPFVHSHEFMYANSDGSSSDVPLQGLITAETALAKLIHDTVLHCGNSEH